ncbi:hypothetical protein [Corynebacterium urinipleomorphum]|uniref:hypothetical protein n=1 Tax=Corynebacterium urinipleomorphum TaxID=1852380 RepID=UPI001F228621|nr:hypothetical protein [Corynebacterium urinipleomorphum]
MTQTHTNSAQEHTGMSWILSILIAAIFTLDPALFSDDHVPYWAYGLKFLALLAAIYTISCFAAGPKDRKHLLVLSAVSAVLIAACVIAFIAL